MIPQPPEHVWPKRRDDTETRMGVTWCRRCGRLLWSEKYGNHDPKPCRVVRITTRTSASSS